MIEYSFLIIIVVANWRLDNAESLAAMLQEKTARTPHTLRIAGGCRTYVHTPGRVLNLFFRYAVCTKKEKAQHGTAAQQHRKNNVK